MAARCEGRNRFPGMCPAGLAPTASASLAISRPTQHLNAFTAGFGVFGESLNNPGGGNRSYSKIPEGHGPGKGHANRQKANSKLVVPEAGKKAGRFGAC